MWFLPAPWPGNELATMCLGDIKVKTFLIDFSFFINVEQQQQPEQLICKNDPEKENTKVSLRQFL